MYLKKSRDQKPITAQGSQIADMGSDIDEDDSTEATLQDGTKKGATGSDGQSKENSEESTGTDERHSTEHRTKQLWSLLGQRKSVISRYKGKARMVARRLMADSANKHDQELRAVLEAVNRSFDEVELSSMNSFTRLLIVSQSTSIRLLL